MPSALNFKPIALAFSKVSRSDAIDMDFILSFETLYLTIKPTQHTKWFVSKDTIHELRNLSIGEFLSNLIEVHSWQKRISSVEDVGGKEVLQ